MFKKLNNKRLSVLFLGLLALVVLVAIMDNIKGGRSFTDNLVPADTSNVTKVAIMAAQGANELIIENVGGQWKAGSGEKMYAANMNKVNSILNLLTRMKPTGVVADNKDLWGEYNVTDSAGVKVKVYEGKKVVADLIIGRFNYKPSNNPYNRTGTFKTYVRPRKDKKVYAVNEMLTMEFSSDLNAYRNNSLTKVNPEDISKVSFVYPSDSSFVLEKNNGKWMLNGLLADSAAVANYISGFRNKTHSFFIEDKPAKPAQYKITIEGNNIVNPIILSSTNIEEKMAVMTSQNLEAVFDGDKSALFSNLFARKQQFIAGE